MLELKREQKSISISEKEALNMPYVRSGNFKMSTAKQRWPWLKNWQYRTEMNERGKEGI